MDQFYKDIIWSQFGAALDTLENAVTLCPDNLWTDPTHHYWYWVSHTTFWLDYYLDTKKESFHPPEPFGMEEMDPAGVLPPRVYTKDALLAHLAHGRRKCRETIQNLDDTVLAQTIKFSSGTLNFGELLLYNMRHVQHHAAQLNQLLRQHADIGARWLHKAK